MENFKIYFISQYFINFYFFNYLCQILKNIIMNLSKFNLIYVFIILNKAMNMIVGYLTKIFIR
jgi:hypothetical protein